MRPLPTGVGVALVTLFDGEGRLLAEDTAAHAHRLAERGVTSILLAGTTGEASMLTSEERVELCRLTKKTLDDRIPVIVGTGDRDQAEAVRRTSAARQAGADAVLAFPPPGVADSGPYYSALADPAGDMPVLAYHFPAVSSPGIPVERLTGLPVAGIKDSSGDAERLAAELELFERPVYVGSAAYLSLAGPIGAAGALLALANTDPEACVAAFGGDIAAQKRLNSLWIEVGSDFPGALKRRLAESAGTSAATRTPSPTGSR